MKKSLIFNKKNNDENAYLYQEWAIQGKKIKIPQNTRF